MSARGPGIASRMGPQGADFAQLLRAYSQLPRAQFAVLSALIGTAVVVTAGFLLAIAIPSDSFADLGGEESAGLLRETLTYAATTTLATLELSFGGGGFALRSAPLLFALFPIGGCALGAYLLRARTAPMPPSLRYAWGAAVGVPFALLMLIISLLAGTVSDLGVSYSVSEGSVFVLSLVWGIAGGVIGTAWFLRGADAAFSQASNAGRALALAGSILRPLAISLLILSVLATALWGVQITRDAGDARGSRSLATALVDDLLYAGDLGYRYQALGSGAETALFSEELIAAAFAADQEEEGDSEGGLARFLPIPIVESKISGGLIEEPGVEGVDARFRIFNYGDALPAWAFAPILLALMVIPAFFALYAGFGASRAASAATPLAGAAWGALVGPVWGVSLALLNTLAQDIDFGQVDSDSMFVLTLFIGAALGALGGIGAAQQQEAVRPASGAAAS